MMLLLLLVMVLMMMRVGIDVILNEVQVEGVG